MKRHIREIRIIYNDGDEDYIYKPHKLLMYLSVRYIQDEN